MKRFYKSTLSSRRPKLLSSKYFKVLYSSLVLGLAIGGVLLVKSTPIVEAACSAPTTNYGTDTMSVSVPSTGSYTIWVRMEIPSSTSDEIMLQDAAGNCFNVGGLSTMATNTYTWVDYQNGATGTPITDNFTAGTQNLELIGSEPGVTVDRILLLGAGDSCAPPTGTGSNCTPPLPVSVPYYQVAGNTGFTDSTGKVWQSDNYYTQDNTYGSTTGESVGGDGTPCSTQLANEGCTSHAITGAATGQQQVYQYERWGAFHYDIPVNNGSYTVVLKFAEINPPNVAITPRLFDVSLEGTQVLTSFSIANQVGDYAADDQTFPVTVTNGDLNITFTSITNTAKLSGLEILPQTPPTITLTAPVANTTVSGASVPISVALANTDSSAKVSYTIDGTAISGSGTSTTWNSTTVADGSHTIGATVTDDGQTVSTSEKVTVANDVCGGAPTQPEGIADSDKTPLPANKVDLTWDASTAPTNCSVTGYYLYRGTSATNVNSTPYATIASPTVVYADTQVSPSTTYYYQVAAYDSFGVSTKTPTTTPLAVTTGSVCSSVSGQPTKPGTPSESSSTYTSVTLTWTASSDSDGCTLSGYHVYRNGTYIGDSNGTSNVYDDTGGSTTLNSGTQYSYYVVAFDSGGYESANSTAALLETEVDNEAPTIPTGLTTSNVQSNSITLSWNASSPLPNPGGDAVGGYNIYRNNSTTPIITLPASDTTWTDTSVLPGTSYQYAIQSFSSNNNPSALSADTPAVTTPPATPTCNSAPSVPKGLSSPSQTTTSITLSWSASTPESGCTFDGYIVYENDVAIAGSSSQAFTTTSTSYTVQGLTPGQSYTFSVAALDTSGPASNPSADITPATMPTTAPPTAPTNFTAKAISSTEVQLNWNASTSTPASLGIEAYNIYRGGTLIERTGNVTSYLDTSVQPSTNYVYTITAYDNDNNPSSSATASPDPVTTPAAPINTQIPGVPTGLQSILITSNTVALTWNATTGATSYTVYRNGTEIGTTTSPEYGDVGLTNQTSYTYTVSASNTAGASAQSTGLTVKTLTSPTTTLLGDFTGSGRVGVQDLAILLSDWGKSSATYNGVNVNIDNTPTIGIQDLATLLSNWTGN